MVLSSHASGSLMTSVQRLTTGRKMLKIESLRKMAS